MLFINIIIIFLINIFIFFTFILILVKILDFLFFLIFISVLVLVILEHQFKINEKEKCWQIDKFSFFYFSFFNIYSVTFFIYIFNGLSFS